MGALGVCSLRLVPCAPLTTFRYFPQAMFCARSTMPRAFSCSRFLTISTADVSNSRPCLGHALLGEGLLRFCPPPLMLWTSNPTIEGMGIMKSPFSGGGGGGGVIKRAPRGHILTNPCWNEFRQTYLIPRRGPYGYIPHGIEDIFRPCPPLPIVGLLGNKTGDG